MYGKRNFWDKAYCASQDMKTHPILMVSKLFDDLLGCMGFGGGGGGHVAIKIEISCIANL